MIIAGLTGGIGHGKTTFADFLSVEGQPSAHFESWELVAEIATGLRNESSVHPTPDDIAAINEWLYPLVDLVELHVHTSVDFSDLRLTEERLAKHPEHYEKLFEYLQLIKDNPALADSDITVETKETFRPLLQWLGGYLVEKANAGIWYDEVVRRITRLQYVDLVTVGGVRYPGDAERLRNAGGVILEIIRPNKPAQDYQDLTERERNLIEADSHIINNGDLDQLEACAKQIYHDLCYRQLQPEYAAAGFMADTLKK